MSCSQNKQELVFCLVFIDLNLLMGSENDEQRLPNHTNNEVTLSQQSLSERPDHTWTGH